MFPMLDGNSNAPTKNRPSNRKMCNLASLDAYFHVSDRKLMLPNLRRNDRRRRGEARAVVLGDRFRVSIKLREIPGGIRSELTARTPETTFRMSPATKVTADIRNFGDKLLVTAAITIPGISGRPKF